MPATVGEVDPWILLVTVRYRPARCGRLRRGSGAVREDKRDAPATESGDQLEALDRCVPGVGTASSTCCSIPNWSPDPKAMELGCSHECSVLKMFLGGVWGVSGESAGF